jgi:hypothetical protein
MISDSLGFRRINDLETCANRDTGVVSGSDEWATEASVCASTSHRLCACISGEDPTICHDYDINKYRGQNCNLILNKYTDLLLVSLVFDTFNLAFVFVLSVFGCIVFSSTFGNSEKEAASPASNMENGNGAASRSTATNELRNHPAPAAAAAPTPVPLAVEEEEQQRSPSLAVFEGIAPSATDSRLAEEVPGLDISTDDSMYLADKSNWYHPQPLKDSGGIEGRELYACCGAAAGSAGCTPMKK